MIKEAEVVFDWFRDLGVVPLLMNVGGWSLSCRILRTG